MIFRGKFRGICRKNDFSKHFPSAENSNFFQQCFFFGGGIFRGIFPGIFPGKNV
jgi:hypothetical protein